MTHSSRRLLLCHPTGQCSAVHRIEVDAVFLETGALCLSFLVQGNVSDILLPDVLPSGPADGLWQHTCCEAFIAAVDRPEYREFNFSPSGQWAAYAFSDYRARDVAFLAPTAPLIRFSRQDDGFRLDVTLSSELLPAGAVFDLALTTVIESADGKKTYWALKHAATQPDFHLRQSFALTIKANTP